MSSRQATAHHPEEPMYQEDSEDFKASKQPSYSRITALLFGLFALIGVGVGIYLFMDHNGYTLKKDSVRSENFQGTVSLSLLAEHGDPEDCWVAFHDNVYDMTEYALIHPGTPSLINGHCGTDATVWFDYEHSVDRLPTVNKYRLGALISDESTQDGTGDLTTSTSPTASPRESSEAGATSQPTSVDVISESTQPPAFATESPTDSSSTAQTTEPPAFATEFPTDASSTAQTTEPPAFATENPTDASSSAQTTKPPATDGCPIDQYTLADVAEHDDEFSCWYVLYGVVYDLTDFVDVHDGGRGQILAYCGTDATDDFEAEKKHDIDLLLNEGLSWYIIGREGSTSGVESVPCDEVDLVAVSLAGRR